MYEKYANPPVEEAVCEFKLTTDTPWDLTVPGLFYEEVRSVFPQREQRVIQELELAQGPQGLQQQLRTSDRVLLFTEDRKTLVQLGPRLLVINALKPYPGWQNFRSCIEMVWRSLQSVLEVRGLDRIGLRYLNRIELPDRNVELAEYFEFYPFIGKRLPQHTVSFIAGAEFSYAGERDRCRVQLAPIPDLTDKSVFMLDIDYFLARPRTVGVGDALGWVEEAHSQVVEIFEGCITEQLRATFQEAK